LKAKKTDRTERQGVGIAMAAFERIDFAFREQHESDYGIDAHAELLEKEMPTGQLLGIQLKTGPSYLSEQTDEGYVFRTDREHIEYWSNHSLPVVIALCDPNQEVVYWQHVTAETTVETGKGYKIIVPFTQKLDSDSPHRLKDLLTPVIPASRYTVFRTDDVSHATAKRYSFDIVVNGLTKKADIAAAVRQATRQGVKRRYYRNHLLEGRWGDADADVVWIFVYLSADDRARRNWVCRSLWIREDLPEESRPIGFDGENIGGLIKVDWNSNYHILAEFVDQHTLRKEEYLAQVVPLIDELESLLGVVDTELTRLSAEEIGEEEFISSTEPVRRRIHDISMHSTDLNLAPFECSEMDDELQKFVAHMDNMILFYSEQGRETWLAKDRLAGALQYRDHSRETLNHLRYEQSKVQ